MLTLGNLSAIPDLCLELICAESNANSITNDFLTSLTGPYLAIVFFLINLSILFNSSSVYPEYAFAIGITEFLDQIPNV